MQKSNRASIIVAIVAVLLILGGVFVLNQTFSNRNRQNQDNEDVAVASSSVSSSRSSARSSSSSVDDDVTENSSTSSLIASSTASNPTSSTASTNSSAGSSSSFGLSSGQVVVKVLSVSGNDYQIQTVDSNGISSKYFAVGAKTKVTLAGVTLSVDKSYKVNIKVTDTASGFSIDLFDVVGQV